MRSSMLILSILRHRPSAEHLPTYAVCRACRSTVLLVDDEDIVRATTADMLTELGYSITEASGAAEAMELLKRGSVPDLMITDHLMPGMTGTDLIQEVRARWPKVHTLLISGFADTESIAADVARLTKPFRQADLAEAIARLRRGSEGEQKGSEVA